MRRGATLMDFAEKIKADPAALVSALFHLGVYRRSALVKRKLVIH
jgi:hypothetical protein